MFNVCSCLCRWREQGLWVSDIQMSLLVMSPLLVGESFCGNFPIWEHPLHTSANCSFVLGGMETLVSMQHFYHLSTWRCSHTCVYISCRLFSHPEASRSVCLLRFYFSQCPKISFENSCFHLQDSGRSYIVLLLLTQAVSWILWSIYSLS